LVFIKKGGEIRLPETLATAEPALHIRKGRQRCQNLIPGYPGDDKNKQGEMNIFYSVSTYQITGLMPMGMN
jgi:hypothetical protein